MTSKIKLNENNCPVEDALTRGIIGIMFGILILGLPIAIPMFHQEMLNIGGYWIIGFILLFGLILIIYNKFFMEKKKENGDIYKEL